MSSESFDADRRIGGVPGLQPTGGMVSASPDVKGMYAAKAAAEKQIMEALENFKRRTGLTPTGVEIDTRQFNSMNSVSPEVYITSVNLRSGLF